MDVENTDECDAVATQRYLRDFYIKDFSYLSPEMFGVKGKTEIISFVDPNEPLTFQLFAKKWLIEVLKGLKEFFYGGSLHGVKYIFEPRFSYKERATWIIIVVISVAFCAINITELFSKWQTSPFVNVIDTIPTPIWAVPFPTVVLCPHLHVKLSYANVSELTNSSKFFASLICPNLGHEGITMPERMSTRENAELQKFITQASPKCTDVVKRCYWRTDSNSEDCCKELLKPIFTNYGLCFAFNSFPLNGMKNVTIPWNKSFIKNLKPSALHWGLDIGYPRVFPPDLSMMPLRTMASGEANGLGVDLYLNASDHQYICDGNSVGFTLIIASPTDHVYTGTVLRLPMHRMTTVEVTPITYKTDWTLKSLSPERRKCFFQDERSLDYYEFYTDSNCKHNLLVQEARRLCDCVLFNWPRSFVWEHVCSTSEDFKCIAEVNAKVEEQLIYAYYENSEEMKPSKRQVSSCHPSCNDILYSSQVFYSDLIKEPGSQSSELVQSDQTEGTKMNVHFYDDLFLGQHRHAQYDDYYFIGAVGGLLSLFLGFSIISVAELVYFVILRPVHLAVKDMIIRYMFNRKQKK